MFSKFCSPGEITHLNKNSQAANKYVNEHIIEGHEHELWHEKTGVLPMGKQMRRSAVQ